jgi:PPOX class probable F420-dependent enzyme
MAQHFADVRHYFESTAPVHVATTMPDGAPHVVPVWVGVEGDRLAFFSGEGSRKDRNLRHDDRVAASVTAPDQPLDMAFVRGRAVERRTGDDALEVVDRIARAYTGKDYDVREGLVVFLVEPEVSWSHDYSAD